jgi:hypothetical protein
MSTKFLTGRFVYLVVVDSLRQTLLGTIMIRDQPPVLRIRIRCYFTPWIRGEFFGSRISDPAPFFIHYLQNPSQVRYRYYLYETGLFLKLTGILETISSKKKERLVLLPPFYIPVPVGLRIRDE